MRRCARFALPAAVLAVALFLASCGGTGTTQQQGKNESKDRQEGAQKSDNDMSAMDVGSGSANPTAVSDLPETPMQGPTQMNGLVMPPGMIMTQETSMEAMEDMAAVDPAEASYTAPADARGDQPLESRDEDGVKVFDLDVSVIEWNILPDKQVAAYAFNQQVPGPRIRVTEGDRVRINVENDLPESTSVHWHGLVLPNEMDGAADVTQEPIEPGESFTYEFTAGQQGTYFYHPHKIDRQEALGMYGALIIDPKEESNSTPVYDKEAVMQLQE